MAENVLLEVKDLRTHLVTNTGTVKAVDGVSFSLRQGEAMGLVGESGCGKTMTCLSIMRLLPRSVGRIVGGEVVLAGENLLALTDDEMRKVRGRRISMILQDPMTSLNPVFPVGEQIAETIRMHQNLAGATLWDKVKKLLHVVRIPSPDLAIRQYPHQMSGGMRQRVAGAISLSCECSLLIADEPTTSLDLTIQAQYLRLLKDVQREQGLAMVMVTHDFGIVARVCDWVSVMYAGQIVESARTKSLFEHPTHPYTKALIDALPKIRVKTNRLYTIPGQPPDLRGRSQGCNFAVRCSASMEKCTSEAPPEIFVADGHRVSCWHAAKVIA